MNAPNWLPVKVRAEGGSWFDDANTDVVSHQLELDLYRGVLTRCTRFRDHSGRILSVTQRRFVSMRDPHFAALETTLVAENWSGGLEVTSALDGTVRNAGVARYETLENLHLVPLRTDRANHEVVSLEVETSQSHVRIAEAARTRLFRDGHRLEPEPELVERPGYVRARVRVRRPSG